MIRIVRGREPDITQVEREWRLARALIEWHERGRRAYQQTWSRDERAARFRQGYTVSRGTLWRRQHKKCAYCEIRISHAEDTEHFRPVNRYWWLTWSWENHFIVCGTCSGAKGHGFPLRMPAASIPEPDDRLCPRPGPEGVWVDPAAEDPRAFIGFAIETRGPAIRWIPTGIDAEDRGQATIADFGLANDERIEQLGEYLADLEAEDDLPAVRAAAARGEVDAARWGALVRRTVTAPRAPWRALAHDYLTDVRAALHREYGVDLPPLPDIIDARPAPTPAPPFTADPLLDALAPLDALYVRSARAAKVPREHRERALTALFDHRPRWTSTALHAVFPAKTPSTLKTWIREAPDLQRDGDDIRRIRDR